MYVWRRILCYVIGLGGIVNVGYVLALAAVIGMAGQSVGQQLCGLVAIVWTIALASGGIMWCCHLIVEAEEHDEQAGQAEEQK